MTKKRIIISASTIQLLLVAALFLPAGKFTGQGGAGENTISVFDMARRYAGLGFSDDTMVFIIFSFCIPTANIIFSVSSLKNRLNFGVPVCLCALYEVVTACFFSSAKVKMVDSVGMTGLHYMLILLAIVSMFLYIYGFFLEARE